MSQARTSVIFQHTILLSVTQPRNHEENDQRIDHIKSHAPARGKTDGRRKEHRQQLKKLRKILGVRHLWPPPRKGQHPNAETAHGRRTQMATTPREAPGFGWCIRPEDSTEHKQQGPQEAGSSSTGKLSKNHG